MQENIKYKLEEIIDESNLHEDLLTRGRKVFAFRKYPKYKQLVIAVTTRRLGLDLSRRLGRVIQIQIKAGVFGSDIYLIRLLNGELVTFENEYFYGLLKHEEKRVEKFMQYDGDNQSTTSYSISLDAEFPETGFLVNSNIRSESQSFSMALTISKEG